MSINLPPKSFKLEIRKYLANVFCGLERRYLGSFKKQPWFPLVFCQHACLKKSRVLCPSYPYWASWGGWTCDIFLKQISPGITTDTILNHWVKNAELVQRSPTMALILSFSGIRFRENQRILLFKYWNPPWFCSDMCTREVCGSRYRKHNSFPSRLFSQHFSVTRKCLNSFLSPLLTNPFPAASKQTHVHRGKDFWDPLILSLLYKGLLCFCRNGTKLVSLSLCKKWYIGLPRKSSRQQQAQNNWINTVSIGIPRLEQHNLYPPCLASWKALCKDTPMSQAFIFHENNPVLQQTVPVYSNSIL